LSLDFLQYVFNVVFVFVVIKIYFLAKKQKRPSFATGPFSKKTIGNL